MRKEDDSVLVISSKGYQQIVDSKDGKNLFWTSDINCELPIKLKPSGLGSETPKTLSVQFLETAARF